MSANNSGSMRPYFQKPFEEGGFKAVGSHTIDRPEDHVPKRHAANRFKRKDSSIPIRDDPISDKEAADRSIKYLENELAANDDPWVGYREHKGIIGHLKDVNPHPTADAWRYVKWLELETPIPNNVRWLCDRKGSEEVTIRSANSRMKQPTSTASKLGPYYHARKSLIPSSYKDGKVIYQEQITWFKGVVPYAEDFFKDPELLDTIVNRAEDETSVPYSSTRGVIRAKDIPSSSELPKGMTASRKDELKASELPYPEDHDDIKSYYRLWLLEHREDTSHNVPNRTFCSAKQLWKNKRLYKSILNKSTIKMYYKPVDKVSRPSPTYQQVVPRTFGNRVRDTEQIKWKPPRPKDTKPSMVRQSTFDLLMNLKVATDPVSKEVARSVHTAIEITDQVIDGAWQNKLHKQLVSKHRLVAYA